MFTGFYEKIAIKKRFKKPDRSRQNRMLNLFFLFTRK